jgi:RHH-type rel operon transcriptional repressor/antitoxin RelB
LDDIARETERPRSFIIQKALESYMEAIADLQVALDRLHDTTDAVVSGKELKADQSDQLVIHSARHARKGWAKRFAAMAAEHDDRLLTAVFSPRRVAATGWRKP